MGKASGRAIGGGCFLMLLGLCFLPAAFQQNADPTILGGGICLFSFGALVAAGGLYLRARALQPGTSATELRKVSGRRLRGGCDLCGAEAPVIQCRVHELHLCSQCLGDHYDFRSCAYVPSSRRALSQKSLARMAVKA
jgi:hypothetical protein